MVNKIVIIMDLLEIWATWIFYRYERVKESLTCTFHFLFTQPCDASDGNYLLSSGKQTFVFIKAVSKICSEGVANGKIRDLPRRRDPSKKSEP